MSIPRGSWHQEVAITDESCISDEAVRALQAVAALLAPSSGTDTDPVTNTLVALEAARTAREYTNNLVQLLTERALLLGASFPMLGFEFADPNADPYN